MVIAIGCMGFNGFKGDGILNFGIDFTSGTKITVQSDSAIKADELKTQLKSLGIHANSVRSMVIRMRLHMSLLRKRLIQARWKKRKRL